MKSSPVEVSFDTSSLLDECHLDVHDLLPEDSACSPTKKSGHAFGSIQLLSATPTPDLLCGMSLMTSDLFQATYHLRNSASSGDLLEGRPLHNDKIEKLLDLLKEGNDDFELDDQLRTRVFKGRFSRRTDPLDGDLDSYLHTKLHNDNKENVSPEPSKKRKDGSALRPAKRHKGASTVLQALPNASNMAHSTNISNNTCNNTIGNSTAEKGHKKRLSQKQALQSLLIPQLLLQPLQLQPTQPLQLQSSLPALRSPNRICMPKSSRIVKPQHLVLKPLNKLDIYLVDSLTGLVNDATQFGTELNASNCEGFPMPEDINEIVQIPTNETVPSSEQQKMALIKAYHSTRVVTLPSDSSYRGFYNKREFDEYVRMGKTEAKAHEEKRRVRWAEDLEW